MRKNLNAGFCAWPFLDINKNVDMIKEWEKVCI